MYKGRMLSGLLKSSLISCAMPMAGQALATGTINLVNRDCAGSNISRIPNGDGEYRVAINMLVE